MPAPTKPKPAPGDPSDSKSTIELPDRFDAEGHRLPEREEEGIVDQLEQLLHSVFSEGRSGGKVW